MHLKRADIVQNIWFVAEPCCVDIPGLSARRFRSKLQSPAVLNAIKRVNSHENYTQIKLVQFYVLLQTLICIVWNGIKEKRVRFCSWFQNHKNLVEDRQAGGTEINWSQTVSSSVWWLEWNTTTQQIWHRSFRDWWAISFHIFSLLSHKYLRGKVPRMPKNTKESWMTELKQQKI